MEKYKWHLNWTGKNIHKSSCKIVSYEKMCTWMILVWGLPHTGWSIIYFPIKICTHKMHYDIYYTSLLKIYKSNVSDKHLIFMIFNCFSEHTENGQASAEIQFVILTWCFSVHIELSSEMLFSYSLNICSCVSLWDFVHFWQTIQFVGLVFCSFVNLSHYIFVGCLIFSLFEDYRTINLWAVLTCSFVGSHTICGWLKSFVYMCITILYICGVSNLLFTCESL